MYLDVVKTFYNDLFTVNFGAEQKWKMHQCTSQSVTFKCSNRFKGISQN